MKATRFICIALIAVLCICAFAACTTGNDEKSTPESKAPVSESEPVSAEASEPVSEETSDSDPLGHLETQDLDITVTFLVENYNGGGYGSREIMPMEDSPIAPYVKQRNDLIYEKLGVTIDEIRTDTMTTDLRNAALSDLGYDIAMPYMTTAAPLITEDLFYDLYEFDDIIRFDKPYWDQNAEEALSLGGHLYMTTGDFSVLTLDVTHCMLFNRKLIADNNLEDPYTLVEQNKWTLDKMLSMAKEVTADTDGISGISYTDTIGLMINTNYSNSLFIGSGENFAKKNSSGVPALTIYNTNSTSVVAKIFEIFSSDKVLNIESFNDAAKEDGFTNCYYAARDALGNNRALFVTISLSDVLNMSDYQDKCDFGLLVTPKYSEEQESYHSYISIIFATGCVIPKGNPNPETAALVLEALAASSTDTVKYNYYERILKVQKLQDEQSEKMLDYIFDNRVYDIGALYNWGSLRDFVSTSISNGVNNFTSDYQSKGDSIIAAMSDTIDYYS